MNFNFELIIFYLTLGCGILAAADILFFAKKRRRSGRPPADIPLVFDYARSFFPLLLLVFLLRSFLFEPFRIPTGSLRPTVQVGDFVLVNKYTYGIRLPVIHHKITSGNPISRGDIVVFRYPPDPSQNYIKRVVGLPGDTISYINKVLYVNGKKMPQVFVGEALDRGDASSMTWRVGEWEENLSGVKHSVYRNPDRPAEDFENRVIPKGHYFVMGDNRDNSDDSRSWGLVPDNNVVGRARIIWLSWDGSASSWLHKIRWHRLGTVVH